MELDLRTQYRPRFESWLNQFLAPFFTNLRLRFPICTVGMIISHKIAVRIPLGNACEKLSSVCGIQYVLNYW